MEKETRMQREIQNPEFDISEFQLKSGDKIFEDCGINGTYYECNDHGITFEDPAVCNFQLFANSSGGYIALYQFTDCIASNPRAVVFRIILFNSQMAISHKITVYADGRKEIGVAAIEDKLDYFLKQDIAETHLINMDANVSLSRQESSEVVLPLSCTFVIRKYV